MAAGYLCPKSKATTQMGIMHTHAHVGAKSYVVVGQKATALTQSRSSLKLEPHRIPLSRTASPVHPVPIFGLGTSGAGGLKTASSSCLPATAFQFSNFSSNRIDPPRPPARRRSASITISENKLRSPRSLARSTYIVCIARSQSRRPAGRPLPPAPALYSTENVQLRPLYYSRARICPREAVR